MTSGKLSLLTLTLFLIISGLFITIGTPSTAQAAEYSTSVFLRTYDVPTCNFWTPIRTSGLSAYGCANYPMNLQVAEANSLRDILSSLEDRIIQLESKNLELQKEINNLKK